MNKTFNKAKTLVAFQKSEGEYSWLEKKVISNVLEGDYLTNHSNKVWDAVADVALLSDEMLESEFSGELALRIPPAVDVKKFTEYDVSLSKAIAANTMYKLLIHDNGYKRRSEGKSIMKDGSKVVIPIHYILLNGERKRKDKYRGIEFVPGVVHQKYVAGFRLKPEFVLFHMRMASMPFKWSAYTSLELLQKQYELTLDYNNDECAEGGTAKRKRLDEQAVELFANLAERDEVYLPTWFDERGRLYYYAVVQGFNPHGKLCETLNIDMAEPAYMDEAGVNHVKHIIMTLRHGRISLENAVKRFSEDDLQWAHDQDPLDEDLVFDGTDGPLEELGERMLANKAAEAIVLYENGFPCHYMFGKDLTNSGLIVASTSFHSPEMMIPANVGALKTVHDSHGDLNNALGLGLDRKTFKKRISQGLFHGSSLRSIGNVLNELTDSEDYSRNKVAELLKHSYGESIMNIDTIATWGAQAVDSYCTRLRFTAPDGFPASHKAHFKHVPIKIKTPCIYNKKGYSSVTVISSMPLAVDKKGFPIHANGEGKGVYTKNGVEVKVRGLYANMTHTLDAVGMRKVGNHLLDQGATFLLKHDDYMTAPSQFDGLIDLLQEFLTDLYENNYYQQFLDEIGSKHKRLQYVPTLVLGDAKNTAKKSVNFLQP